MLSGFAALFGVGGRFELWGMDNSPQLKDGYTKIADEILEAIAVTNLSPYESRVLWCIIRKTYGFSKKNDWIANSQIIEKTGLLKGSVSKAKAKLLARNIVTQTGNKIGLNKMYKQWKKLPKQVTVTQMETPVTQTETKVSIQRDTIKTYTKDTITKDIYIPDKESEILSEEEEFTLWLNTQHIFPSDKRLTAKACQKWGARRRSYSSEKIRQAFSNLVNEPDKWKINNNGHRSLHWWLHSDDRIEDMLNCHLKSLSKKQAIFIS